MEEEVVHVLSTKPLEKILVDIYEPLPTGIFRYTYIFVVLDNFTRYVRLYPSCRANSKNCLSKIVNDYISTHGVPSTIVSDHGRQFVSKVWQIGLTKAGVSVTKTSVYHPQSNPAERVMRELGRLFRTYCISRHSNWPQYVPYIEWVLNNVRHEATNYTPSELFPCSDTVDPFQSLIKFPTTPNISQDQSKKFTIANQIQLSKAQQRKARHDRNLKPIRYTVGDMVLVRTHKLSCAADRIISKFFLLYEGPFVVTDVKNKNLYTLQHPETRLVRGTYNTIHLKAYIPPVDT